ncbi:MAG TPA: PQQ-binding-like beta-propeller repeat protein [Polyangia bacterium]|nr:PQQ-binding-like beta-propeller repeat protein [Polyangia bacterium]
MTTRTILLAALAAVSGCASVTARPVGETEAPAHSAGVLQMVWRTTLHEHGLFEPEPEECATGALANGHLVIGSRAANVVGVAPDTGHVDWVTGVSGGVDSTARFDPNRGQVYVGADDGTFYAFDPASGAVRWTYHGKGAFERAPELGADLVYTASATDRVVALEPATGKWRWQYEREMPEGFTIHGYAAPRLHGNQLLTGFADGYFVSLAAATGEVVWARSLATASEQFVDVDTTPALAGNLAYVASYSGGLCAVDLLDGAIKWRLGVEGVGDVSVADGRLFFVAPRQGLHSADLEGHVIWRQGLTEAGDLTKPMVVGRYLIFSGSRAGLFIVDRTGGGLLEVFNPGHGVCSAPTLDEKRQRLYVLSNSGSLYALDLGAS